MDEADVLLEVESGKVLGREAHSHYERNEQMIGNVLRDMDVVGHMRTFNKPLVEASFAAMTDTIVSAFGDRPALAARRRAMVSVAIGFETWKSLVRAQQLTTPEAVDLMTDAVLCAGRDPDTQQGRG